MSYPPQRQSKIRPRWLLVAAGLIMSAWLTVETTAQRGIHPRFSQMLSAARTMQAASAALRAEKEALGLLQSPDIDPGRTGMIGQEFTGITTTMGDIGSKRTATNPDVAAVIVKQLDTLRLPRKSPVVLVVSGSFVGADVAAIAAVEALDLRPILIASLGASMWGANDPSFNLMDMLVLLRERGIIRTGVLAGVIGGEGAIGSGMDRDGIAALQRSAEKAGVSLVDARPVSMMIDALLERVQKELGDGVRPAAVINVGGALAGLGTCRESYELPPGFVHVSTCQNGTPGLAFRLAEAGAPMLNVINFRRLAIEQGLPFDPRPLPSPGNNMAIYGAIRTEPH